jgi:hypothetical protein
MKRTFISNDWDNQIGRSTKKNREDGVLTSCNIPLLYSIAKRNCQQNVLETLLLSSLSSNVSSFAATSNQPLKIRTQFLTNHDLSIVDSGKIQSKADCSQPLNRRGIQGKSIVTSSGHQMPHHLISNGLSSEMLHLPSATSFTGMCQGIDDSSQNNDRLHREVLTVNDYQVQQQRQQETLASFNSSRAIITNNLGGAPMLQPNFPQVLNFGDLGIAWKPQTMVQQCATNTTVSSNALQMNSLLYLSQHGHVVPNQRDIFSRNMQFHFNDSTIERALASIPRSLPVLLAQPEEDRYKISDHQYLLRQQIEIFEASEEDITTHIRGRNKPITFGQVGIRCKHCSHVHVSQRQKGSTYFPFNKLGIYQAAQNMSTTHIQCGLCKYMPETIKQQFVDLMSNRQRNTTSSNNNGAGRIHWAKTATLLGVIDTDNGMRFIRTVHLHQQGMIRNHQTH